jgi:hypothetical protein
MDYGDFIQGISFRFCKPRAKPWPLYHPRWLPADDVSRVRWRLDLAFEVMNTRLPTDSGEMRRRLRELCKIRRMSTYAIAAMINAGIARMDTDHSFVNVGVWNGFTLLSGMMDNPSKRCVGVDNFSEFGGPYDEFMARFEHYRSANHVFHNMDYEEYFAKIHQEPIGFYIYDAEHSYENQLKGLQVAEPFFAPDCIVLVDDTNLDAPRNALFDFIAQSRNSYRVLLDRRTRSNLHPTLWNGVIVVQRTNPEPA